MKKLITTLLVFIGAFAFTSLYAMQFGQARTGLNFSIQGGAGKISAPDNNHGYTNTVESSQRNYSVVGGATLGFDYAIKSWWSLGIESGFFYSPKNADYTAKFPDNTPVELYTDYYNIPVLLTSKFVTPIGFTFFVKGGMTYMNQNIKFSSATITGQEFDESVSTSKWLPMAGVGVGYQIYAAEITLQYNHIFGKGSNYDAYQMATNSEKPSPWAADQIMLGINFTIPM